MTETENISTEDDNLGQNCRQSKSCVDIGSLESSLEVLSQELERERQEKKLLQKIAASVWSLDELLDEVLFHIQNNWGFTAFIIQIVDEQKNVLKCHRYTGINTDNKEFEKVLTSDIDLSQPDLSISSKVANRQKLFYARKTDLNAQDDLLEMDAKTLSYMDIKDNLLVPIIDHGSTIGVFQLLSVDKSLGLSIKEIRDIKRFIASLSGTIRLLKNNYENERIKSEQKQIIDLVNKLGATIDLKQILSIFGNTVVNENDLDGYLILLKSNTKDILECESISLPKEYASIIETYNGFKANLDDKNPYSVVFNTKTVRTYYFSEHEKYNKVEKDLFSVWRLKSYTIVPVVKEGESIGVLVFFSQTRNIRQSDIYNIEKLVPFLASKIEFSQYYDVIKSREEEVNRSFEFNTSFLEFISEINTVATVEDIYNAFSKEIISRYNFYTSMVFMIEDDCLKFNYIYQGGENCNFNKELEKHFRATDFTMNKDGGALVLAIKNGSAVFIPDVQAIKDLPMVEVDRKSVEKFPEMSSLLHIPLRKHGEIIGLYTLVGYGEPVGISKEDAKIIERLCSFMGTVIVNANLYTQIGKQKDEIERTLEELKNTQEQLVETERSRLDAMQRAVESAQAATAAKSGFLANMSHEIRTPLNAIIGLTELLLQTEQNPKQQDYSKKIFSSSKSLLDLINDILDFSKIEAGKFDIESTFFNLKSVTRRIKDIFATKAHENNNKLNIKIEDDVPVHLIGDPLRLSQVIINLTNNALKFTKDGNVDIQISLEKQTYDEAKIKFEVHDTGTGISKEKIGNLFESFTQADSSTTRKFGGTGLGLTISKSIVELMGGRIWAESELGKGSTFAFTILFATSSDGIEAKLKNNTKGKKVLIADDNEAIKVYLTYELHKIGMDVTAVNDAQLLLEAYDKSIKYFPYDLIITDWRMPNMDGIELVEKLRNDYGDNDTPIIMVSAYSSSELKSKALESGVNSWLSKPIKDTELHKAISEIFIDPEYDDENLFNTNIAQAYEKVNGARLLLVEDNFINQQVAQEMLQGVGVTVDLADHGVMALEILEKNSAYYDAVLTDIQMPEMDGYTFCKELRKINHFSDLPVIAMTADAITGVKDQCLKAGMNDYVTKPVNYSELIQTLSKWVTPKNTNVEKVITFIGNKKSSSNNNTDDDLDLPGIDLKKACERMAGNRKLAISVITSFATDFYNAPESIQTCLRNNNKDEAIRIVHTVKGLVKTFSTKEVIEDTVALEDAIKNDKGDVISVLLSKFRSSLQPVFESANLLIELNETESVSDNVISFSKQKETVSESERVEKIWCFINYLQDNDFLAKDYLDEIKGIFDENAFGSDLEQIGAKLNEFDFIGALNIFGKIATHYGIEIKGN